MRILNNSVVITADGVVLYQFLKELLLRIMPEILHVKNVKLMGWSTLFGKKEVYVEQFSCQNCSWSGGMQIPKGQLAEKFAQKNKCPECGTKELIHCDN